jgi:hypothetical protein
MRVAEQVRLVDLMPTILDLVGLEISRGFEGISLVPLLEGGAAPAAGDGMLFPSRIAYAEGIREGPERKAIAAYPWKLVYEVSSAAEQLYNLARDSDEMENVVEQHRDVAAPLEEHLGRALFEMSDQWFVEVCGGDAGHVFDLTVSTESGNRGGWLCPFQAGREGRRELPEAIECRAGPVFKIEGLQAPDPVMTGLRIHAPGGLRPEMDFRIDGKSAERRTFIGEALENPGSMPFALPMRAARAASASGPAARPDPPYILIWRVAGRYAGETPADLSEDAKKELRALGYIQ